MTTTGTTTVATEKLLKDFNEVVTDTEELLKSFAAAGGEKSNALRANLEQSLAASRERLRQLEARALDRSRAAAKATDEYVHVHPWQSIAIAAGVSAIVGVVVGLLLNRD